MSFIVRDAKFNWYDQDFQINTKLNGITFSVVALTPGAVAANSTVIASATIRGVKVGGGASDVIPGDVVLVFPLAALPTGIALGIPYVTAANTVAIPFINPTSSSQTPSAGAEYAFIVFHFGGQASGIDA